MYTIILLNTIFDKENDNVLLCNSKQELQAYFDTITDKVVVASNINFDVNDLITTKVVVDVPLGLSFLKLLNYNYCIVKNNDDVSDISYWFVNNSRQDVGNRVVLDLQIDWFNTYWYDISNLQGLLIRTHLDRFIKYNGQYVYNFGVNSPLFEREDIQGFAKRPTKKYKLLSHYDTSSMDSVLDDWLNANIECWKYYFISAGKNYNFSTTTDGGTNFTPIEKEINPMNFRLRGLALTSSNIVVLCAPVYKNVNITINFRNSETERRHIWSQNSVEKFLRDNNNYANVYSIKYSQIAPFYITQYINGTDYDIDPDGYTLRLMTKNNADGKFFKSKGNSFYSYLTKDGEDTFVCVDFQSIQSKLILSIPEEMYKIKFNANDINNNCEPKLYNEDYSIYRLYFGGSQYELPISKSSNKPYFIYKEIIMPDITKSILIFNAKNSNDEVNSYFETIFNEISEKDFTGFISTLDNSLWFTSDQLDTFLATNKNNLQIFQNQQQSRIWQTASNAVGSASAGIVSSLATGSPIGIFSGLIHGATQGINTIIQNEYEKQNYNLNLDNMRNSPQELQSLNSNAVLISSVDEFGIYIEMQEAIPFEQQQIVDYLKIFGYNYRNIANINNFVKTRKYYNYIQANIFDVDGKIAEQIKDLIKQSISKGIRFWHKDNFTGVIDFTLNNIERSVTNG